MFIVHPDGFLLTVFITGALLWLMSTFGAHLCHLKFKRCSRLLNTSVQLPLHLCRSLTSAMLLHTRDSPSCRQTHASSWDRGDSWSVHFELQPSVAMGNSFSPNGGSFWSAKLLHVVLFGVLRLGNWLPLCSCSHFDPCGKA
jgi:hypothetical protein